MLHTLVDIERMSLEDYIDSYETEGAFEIINGERIPLMPNVTIHVLTIKRLIALFIAYEQRTQQGEAFSEAPFVLLDSPNWVKGSRVPDVMYFSAERLMVYREQVPDWKDKPFILVPELAVEVVSANDRYTQIQEKVEVYQADGVKLIWVIDPHRQKVIVHAGNTQTILSTEDTLSGSEVVPDFTVSIADLFA
jgi:Uma2 family endonuclease